jgi:quercetin dioxygenase-like cupin family protein
MKIIKYTDVNATLFESDKAKGVAGRVVIGKSDGADHFCMRVFEISPGGYTPQHAHEWEHEIFIHAGEGEIYHNGRWNPVRPGNVVFMPPNEEHQMRNSGKELFVFVCLVPSKIPEL